MDKIVTVIGARPQFIKAAALSSHLRERFSEVLVHTGQHFDEEMSGSFFSELSIPAPDYHLGIHSLSHGALTGRMVEAIEKVLLKENPRAVLVFGDTDSTLAGALAASKLRIPVIHVEAGLRSFRKTMPEEINRKVVDHLSSILFAPTETGRKNLEQEGISENVFVIGDLHLDLAARFTSSIPRSDPYYLATLHRAENVDEPSRLKTLLEGLAKADLPVYLPLHPRTKKRIEEFSISMHPNIRVIPPQGYAAMLAWQKGAKAIATDSGGVQKEAYFFGVPCLILREETEWTELTEQGAGKLLEGELAEELRTLHFSAPPHLFGKGDAGCRIAERLYEHL